MLGLSKIQLGLLIGAAALVACLSAYGISATKKIGALNQAQKQYITTIEGQEKQKKLLQQEIAHRDALVTKVQAERDALAKQKQKVKTVFREILITDEEAAKCGNADLPAAVSNLMHQFQSGRGNGNGEVEATSELNPDSA